jgi:GT2 family glycosyltransferase
MCLELSVIIVNWNTSQLLYNCLQSLASIQKNFSWEIIVIDNGSVDDSVEMCRKFFPDVNLIINKNNMGFGYANNQGISASNSNLVLLLNSDTIVHANSIEEMIRQIQLDTSIGVLGCRLINSDGSFQASCMNFPNLTTVFVERFLLYKLPMKLPQTAMEPPYISSKIPCDWVMGACMLVRKKALDEAGLFDTNIWMYGEEMDLCYRIKKAGWKIIFYPAALIEHLGGGSWKEKSYSATLLKMAGLLYFFKKHYSFATFFIVFLLSTVGAFLRYLLWTGLYIYKKDEGVLQEMRSNGKFLAKCFEIFN